MRVIVIASVVVGLGWTSAGAETIALKGGESRTHDVALASGQALVGDVVQQGIDVVVTVTRPDGTAVLEVDSPNGADGPEPVALVATAAGLHRIQVRALESDAPPGAYELRLEPARRATARDRERVEALRLHTNAFRARGEALALQGRGQYERSRALYQRAARDAGRALRLRTRALGTGHYDVAATHQVLGLIDDEVGNYASGERHFARALAIQQALFGPGHPATLTTQSDLGYLRLAAGDYAAAVAAFTESLARREQLFGRDHPRLLAGLGGLAEAYLKQGDLDRAEATSRRELALRETVSQPSPSARTMLGRILIAHGRVAEGEAACAEARATLSARPESGRTLLASAALCAAAGRLAAGDPAGAAPLAAEGRRLREAAGGHDHPWVAEALVAEADVLVGQGRAGDARRALLRAQRIQQRRLGDRHPAYLETTARLARVISARTSRTLLPWTRSARAKHAVSPWHAPGC
jgi:tetratricopeptide (TPR) repeat protein